MALVSITSLILFLAILSNTWALQVSPNSPCALECLDDPTQDVSDPNTSNTYGGDLSCLDSTYDTTAVGQKFKSCVTCLQNSTVSDSGENDQDWFLYNLRYTLSSCLFDFARPSDAVSTPCSTKTSCEPLQEGLEMGNFMPGNQSTYSYCSARQHSFMGSSLDDCISCLRSSRSEVYLSNFLIALKAGCQQQPPLGTNIGIQGSLFSTTPINITYPGYNPESDQETKHGMTQRTIIGMSVGLGILGVIFTAIIFVCCRKRIATNRSLKLRSFFDPRFGSPFITSPNSGAYGNPYANPPISTGQQFTSTSLSAREIETLEQRGVLPKTSPQFSNYNGYEKHHINRQPPKYAEAVATMPTHQAYIPSYGPASPTTSFSTDNSYQLAAFPSPRNSPNAIPPSRVSPNVIPSSRTSPNIIPPSRTSPNAIPPSRTSPNAIPPSRTSPNTIPPSRTSPRNVPPPIFTNLGRQQAGGSEHDRQEQLWAMQQQEAAQQQSGSDNRTDNNQSTNQDVVGEIRAPARAMSRVEGWRGGQRSTSRPGIGNVNASAVESMDVPVQISAPMVVHGGRFDFEMAQRERAAREAYLSRSPTASPDSRATDSPDEQWPGKY